MPAMLHKKHILTLKEKGKKNVKYEMNQNI